MTGFYINCWRPSVVFIVYFENISHLFLFGQVNACWGIIHVFSLLPFSQQFFLSQFLHLVSLINPLSASVALI